MKEVGKKNLNRDMKTEIKMKVEKGTTGTMRLQQKECDHKCPYRYPSETVCAHRKIAFLTCVRTQFLIYINKNTFFLQKTMKLLVTLPKARNFASSKGKKTVTSE